MLLGVISDTHLSGELLPTEVVEMLEGCDMILHAGDILDHAVIRQLSGIAPTIAVCGNMDPGSTRVALPRKTTLEVPGFRIGLVHGSGPPGGITRRVRSEFIDDGVDCIVFGHTHRPLVETAGGLLLFNPGSPTDRRFADTRTVGFLEIGEAIVPRIEEVGHAGREDPGI